MRRRCCSNILHQERPDHLLPASRINSAATPLWYGVLSRKKSLYIDTPPSALSSRLASHARSSTLAEILFSSHTFPFTTWNIG